MNVGLILQCAEGLIGGVQCAAINDPGSCFINHKLCRIQIKERKEGERKEIGHSNKNIRTRAHS